MPIALDEEVPVCVGVIYRRDHNCILRPQICMYVCMYKRFHLFEIMT